MKGRQNSDIEEVGHATVLFILFREHYEYSQLDMAQWRNTEKDVMRKTRQSIDFHICLEDLCT
jgi:hypothetical protein